MARAIPHGLPVGFLRHRNLHSYGIDPHPLDILNAEAIGIIENNGRR
ncbi:MAG: hypothetical protein HDS83_03340 [Bacteroidales bacterium]|nr:hypothetical protein [Bacteroidales bacterium]